MKKIYGIGLMTAMVIVMAGCRCNKNQEQVADSLNTTEQTIDWTDVQTGDLLLFELPLDYTLNLEDTSVSPILPGDEVSHIHIAMMEKADDGLYVIDATLKFNVDRHPLDSALAMFTLKNGKLPRMEVYRLKDNSDVARYIANAKPFMGRPYDLKFTTATDQLYCSELVYNCYVSGNGDTLFALNAMDWRANDGSTPEYWKGLFGWIGIEVPQGVIGITPRDITESELVEKVGVIK